MKRSHTMAALALTLLSALPATADLYYTARTWQEGDQASQAMAMTVEAWVRGGEAGIRFTDSSNPMMSEGTRLVVQNDARDIYLVDDAEETVTPFSLDALVEMASALMQGVGSLVNIEVNNPKVETLLVEPGEEIAGYPTTHYRFRTRYELAIKVFGMGQRQQVDTIQDSWVTTAFDDSALGVWLTRDPPDFGNSELEKLIELEKQKLKGFPMKTVIEETSTGKKGRATTTRTITEVTRFEADATAPTGAYGWPAHYRMVEAMPADAAGSQEEEPKKGRLKGLFGGGEDG